MLVLLQHLVLTLDAFQRLAVSKVAWIPISSGGMCHCVSWGHSECHGESLDFGMVLGGDWWYAICSSLQWWPIHTHWGFVIVTFDHLSWWSDSTIISPCPAWHRRGPTSLSDIIVKATNPWMLWQLVPTLLKHTHSRLILYKHPFSYIDERLGDSQWTIWLSATLIDNSHYWLLFLSESPSVGLSGLLKVIRVEGKSERHSKGLACLTVQMVDNVAFNLFKCMVDYFHV